MCKDFTTIYILTEYNMDFVLSRPGKICWDMIVYHEAVAVKVTKDTVMQENKVDDKRVQKSNFFLVLGGLQLSLTYT